MERGGGDPSGWPVPEWTLEKDLAFNDEEDIAFAFLTITAPGAEILPPGEEQARFCRKANEYAAEAEAETSGFLEDARTFYSDTALSTAPPQLALLGDFARPGHVLFGSDFPYAPTPAIRRLDGLLDQYAEKDAGFVHSVNSVRSALKLFPRLAGWLAGLGVIMILKFLVVSTTVLVVAR